MSALGKLRRAQEERRARLGIDEQGIEHLNAFDHNGDPVYSENSPYDLALEEGLAVELAEAGLEGEPIVGDPDVSPFMKKKASS